MKVSRKLQKWNQNSCEVILPWTTGRVCMIYLFQCNMFFSAHLTCVNVFSAVVLCRYFFGTRMLSGYNYLTDLHERVDNSTFAGGVGGIIFLKISPTPPAKVELSTRSCKSVEQPVFFFLSGNCRSQTRGCWGDTLCRSCQRNWRRNWQQRHIP